jgi:hypothetical protein
VYAPGAPQTEVVVEASGPFVDSVHQADVSQAAQVPAPTSASKSAEPAGVAKMSESTTTSGKTSEKPRLQNKAELLDELRQQRRRLSDQYTDAVILEKGFGSAFTSWEQVDQQPAASLRNPLKRLQALTTEQPPADHVPTGEGYTGSPVASSPASAEEEIKPAQAAPFVSSVPGQSTDVPSLASGPHIPATGSTTTPSTNTEEDVADFPPPEGNPKEGPQQTPGATQVDGASPDAEVASNVEGEAWWLRDAPPEEPEVMSIGPNKGNVVTPYVIALESWATKVGCIDIFTRETASCPTINGVLAMLPDQYRRAHEAILLELHQRGMKAY